MTPQDLVNRAKTDALNGFSHAIFPIYLFQEGENPEHVGTCFAIEYSSKYFLITAAHVIDHQKAGQLVVGSTSQKLVTVQGAWHVSDAGESGRNDDPIDLAWHELNDEERSILQVVQSSQIEREPPTSQESRVLTMIGFPRSKNKKISAKNTRAKNLSPVRAQYADLETIPHEHFKSRGMSSDTHIAMRRGNQSMGENGDVQNTIGHIGFSGGPMIFAGLVDADPPIRPQTIVGMVIESGDSNDCVVALRMSEIISRIDRNMGQTPTTPN
ncbi:MULTISPECIES: trypsin-like serine protease [Stenotrophomonas]|uniref:Trypsin-like peptidase domain-containing protein n=1 Tax=Stenotrophomonas lactitubi TaxID=2045214 RepID=A0AAW4GDG8_9GAMM|nr:MULTISPECIES: trypsin-like serine protease [Stenotrophomonas]MBM9912911.1 trypsin-like peptidase domain-containing protein [Stenotrophomonas lactitubi]MBM9922536.1 trypsin-like peptidase domain-containing protein [Stenotrophomonas lactitubi]MBM9937561.1 trypsin-like peptidase domain-containing protein [Stenotrophomonas lactitubi]